MKNPDKEATAGLPAHSNPSRGRAAYFRADGAGAAVRVAAGCMQVSCWPLAACACVGRVTQGARRGRACVCCPRARTPHTASSRHTTVTSDVRPAARKPGPPCAPENDGPLSCKDNPHRRPQGRRTLPSASPRDNGMCSSQEPQHRTATCPSRSDPKPAGFKAQGAEARAWN